MSVSTRAHVAEGRSGTGAPRRDIRALTGLRAVAATWVVLYHVAWLSSAYLDQLPALHSLLRAGWTGVELFFVLSGFVIAHSYLDEMGARWRTGESLRFLFNRLARVWPSYAVVTVVAFAWLFAIGQAGWAVDVVARHPEATVGELARQLTMTQMWGEGVLTGQSFNPPGWSISAEWFAYLLFPVLALLLRPLRRLPAVVLLGLGCAAMVPLFLNAYLHGTPDVATSWVLRIGCCFVAGILACLAFHATRPSVRSEQWGLVLSVVCVVGVVTGSIWAHWRAGVAGGGDYAGIVTILYPVLIVGLALSERGPSRWLSSGPLVYGGRISYCLYLVHFVVMDVAITVAWQDVSRRGQVTPAVALAIPVIVLVSMALAAVLHQAVEEPARRRMLALWTRVAAPAEGRRPAARERIPAGGGVGGGDAPEHVEPVTARLAGHVATAMHGDRRSAGAELPPRRALPPLPAQETPARTRTRPEVAGRVR
ncbi:acyltransferase [Blastococcus sp. KM273129]|uniref:acyltransferase family protein n=1 Tax=Blastococcus sp. KM273129 TaxID=2570315 RepID=UPI001F2CF219|nr:acyltransferase [Blastococcus sp. KM273129]MCF6735323.1 acyltransferase [Blastococcus sp. KM273129]